MPATVIVGLQWGDEGKGKTTDFLAEQVAMVVRYQGGDNAGHTVVVGDEVFKLQLCPSGVLYPHITSVIGNGVVVNPVTLIDELDMLAAARHRRVQGPRQPQRARDHAVPRRPRPGNETRLGGAKVGTTGRGIGPTYGDRAWRLGPAHGGPARRARPARAHHAGPRPTRTCCSRAMGVEPFEVEPLVDEAPGVGRAPRARTSTTPPGSSRTALRRGDHVLLEGAQGTLLDLDHGSYPFVTSSNPVAGGACTGGGIGPLQVDEVIGVMKAYSTRVGSGPFPTELFDEIGRGIAERGREFGTVTGRPAASAGSTPCPCATPSPSTPTAPSSSTSSTSCPASRRSSCASPTRSTASRVETWPSSGSALSRAVPIYEDFEGWEEPIHDVRSLADLPENARRYVSALEEHAGVPIVFVSVGPERTQTIERAWRPMRHRPTTPA